MELLHLPQSWQCSHDTNDDESSTNSIKNAFTIVSPIADESVSYTQRPVWDLSPRHHEEQEGEDDYAWYYNNPERIIWRPRRSRLIKSRPQKVKQFTAFDLLLNFSSRDSWSGTSVSETQDSMHSQRWSLLSSSTLSTKVSEISFPKN